MALSLIEAMRKGAMSVKEFWETEALCRVHPTPEVFFPPSGRFESAKDRHNRETRAKTVCKACPVVKECLAYALKVDWLIGIWGDTNRKERAAMRTMELVGE